MGYLRNVLVELLDQFVGRLRRLEAVAFHFLGMRCCPRFSAGLSIRIGTIQSSAMNRSRISGS
jgi:hypothetical protein